MRKLHVVGFTSDLDGLIFSTRKGAKSGSFVVSIGEELMDKLDEVQRLRNGVEPGSAGPASSRWDDRERRPRPESSLTPREIQSRLRAGRTIDEVAREAGVDTEWVERFAAPILAEQRQVVELARSLTFSKSRLGESAEPLGESVAANLIERGVHLLDDEFDTSWSAFQLRDGVWTVRFGYRSRGRLQQATWELDVAANRLVSRDRLASDLGYVERPRRRRRLAEGEEAAEAVAEASPVVVRVPARRSAVIPAASARPARRRSPPAAKTTGPAPAKPARQASPAKAAKAARKSATAKAAAGPAKAPARPAKRGSGGRTPAAPKPARPAKAAKAPAGPKATRSGRAAKATKGQGGDRSTPAPPAEAATEAGSRPRRPLAPRPAGPRFGTDGTRLGGGTAAVPRPPPPPRRTSPTAPSRSFRPEPPPPRPRSVHAGGGTDNGATPTGRPVAEPAPAGRLPSAARPAPDPAPPPSGNDLEYDLDLHDLEGVPPRPDPPRPPIAIGPPPGAASSEDRDGRDDQGAFVIRPRISARQASELRFDAVSPTALPAQS